MYLTLRGTPILYYGEELGMENNDPVRKEDVKDPLGIAGWPEQKGRDGERTPMQWDGTRNAGFTRGVPWLPVPPSATTHNVAAESQDPNSVLQFYRRLLALRRKTPALLDGAYIPLNGADPNVLSYIRRYKDDAVLVVLNMSAKSETETFDLVAAGVEARGRNVLLTTLASAPSSDPAEAIVMQPFSVYIASLTR
jgi:alpha-glucosidase